MEDEKRKKKNKKKKNKQNKNVVEEVTVGGGEAASVVQNHQSNGKDDHSQLLVASDVQNPVHDVDADLYRHQPNGTECSALPESEKLQWLQRVSTLEETIKQLQKEKYLHVQKEASLEETIKHLQTEKDMHIKKESNLENTIKQLQKENDSHIQKAAAFEDAIKQLQDDNNSHLQKASTLDVKILQLQDEKDSLLQKEVGLKEKVNQLMHAKTDWDSKEASLQERIKHLEGEKDSLILKEDMTKNSIAILNEDIARLRVQVVELEESRNSMLQENKRLVENISCLQLQIKDFETISSTLPSDKVTKSEHDDLNSQVEAACAMVEKLVTENADLVEKVNELYAELEQHTAISRLSSTASAPDPVSPVITSVPERLPQIEENVITINVQESNLERVQVKEERDSISNIDSVYADEMLKFSTSDASSEIVQVPLDEKEVRDLEDAQTDAETAVPLSEAPLIGAPFRLVSFVARYVSGADLVNRNSLDSHR